MSEYDEAPPPEAPFDEEARVPKEAVEIDASGTPMPVSSMEPMKVTASSTFFDEWEGNDKRNGWFCGGGGWMRSPFPTKYSLVTDDNARIWSLRALQFNVLANAINTKLLTPNYAIMVSPGYDEDSFPSTEPFDFNSATYFIPLTALMGVAITSVFAGKLSDKIGRKKVLVVMTILGAIGSIIKYFCRATFWGFCIANFITGLFSGSLPVAMAYVGDVFETKRDKERELGVIVSCFVMGNSGGGIIAILMNDAGLFAPLWVGSGVMWASLYVLFQYFIEPGEMPVVPIAHDAVQKQVDDEEEEVVRPDDIDQCALRNIILGALADNIGSNGLFPLCLSPLALDHYYSDFVKQGLEPIMTLEGYQWLLVMVAFMVVPSTIVTPSIFSKIGAAGGCVFGNTATAIITISLLLIGNAPATNGWFAAFVSVLYLGFPFTVVSQLSTGPMLDVIAPEDKIGYVQGLNNMVMNFGMALAPWMLGLLADAAGTNQAIWTGVAISLMAALINTPLMYREGFGPEKPKLAKSYKPVPGEDTEIVEKVLAGEYIPPEQLERINRDRAKKQIPTLIPKVRTYEEDKEHLDDIRRQALETFQFRRQRQDRVLAALGDPHYEGDIQKWINQVNTIITSIEAEKDQEVHDELGAWFADYLKDNGYFATTQSLLVKQMIVSAFPPITKDRELTSENIEDVYLRGRRIANQYLSLDDERRYSHRSVLGRGSAPVYFS